MLHAHLDSKFQGTILKCISTLLLIALCLGVQAQDKSQIKAEQERIKSELKVAAQQLQTLTKDKTVSIKKYDLLKNQLVKRNTLVENLEQELEWIEADLLAGQADIALVKSRYDDARQSFRLLTKAYYRMRSVQPPLAFIFSSDGIVTAWKRMVYYRKMSRKYKTTLEDLNRREADVLTRVEELELLRTERNQQLSDLKEQQAKLQLDQNSQKLALSRLKKNENFVKSQIKKYQSRQAALSEKMIALISAEADRKKSSNKLPSAASTKLDNAFAKNKGKLPWPVSVGSVIRKFGRHIHPDLKMIYINNNGIDIATASGQPVLCVFDGTVIAVRTIAGYQNTILVNHGSFYTIYANVDNVTVQQGDKVERSKVIASVAQNDDVATLHFEIWAGKERKNPQQWLLRR